MRRYNRQFTCPFQLLTARALKMNKLLPLLFAFVVAQATTLAHAQDIKGNAKAGETKVAMCIGCHGIVGYQASFPEIHRVPMISGQTASYIAAALNAYKKGDRKHPTMRGIAESMSDQDIADVAAFYAGHGSPAKAPAGKPPAPNERVAALLSRNKDNACMSCHGDNFNTPKDAATPKLAGQHADYLLVALKAYKSKGQAMMGRGNPVMTGSVDRYNNAELKEIARYIASLPGDLKTVPEKPFR